MLKMDSKNALVLNNSELSLFLVEEEAANEIEVKLLEPEHESKDDCQQICPICLDDLPAHIVAEIRQLSDRFQFILSCNHQFCTACIQRYVSGKINCREVEQDQLVCPVFGCGVPLVINDIFRSVTSNSFSQYERFIRLNKFENLPNARWCPEPGCETIISCNPSSKKFKCNVCKTSGCFQCGGKFHSFKSCRQSLESSYKQWENSTGARHRKTVKNCPRCRFRIWKAGGCQHMTCTKCKYEWCWICNTYWKDHTGTKIERRCQFIRAMQSRAWGPHSSIRFITKTIGCCVALVAATGGGAIVLGVGASAAVLSIPVAVTYVPFAYVRRKHEERKLKLRRDMYTIQETLQRGVNVCIHGSNNTMSPHESFSTMYPKGRWETSTTCGCRQYIAYTKVSSYSSILYLSHSTCNKPSSNSNRNEIDAFPCHNLLLVTNPEILPTQEEVKKFMELAKQYEANSAHIVFSFDKPESGEYVSKLGGEISDFFSFHWLGNSDNSLSSNVISQATLASVLVKYM